MRALFVTPVEEGSGETITSIHAAGYMVRRGWKVGFLASTFAQRFLPASLGSRVWTLGGDGAENETTWHRALAEHAPDIVIFADYPLMFFNRGCAPLARVPGWTDSLGRVDARLITMDHFGFMSRSGGLFLGPPHLGIVYQELPPLPAGMHVLLPCPMHEPGDVSGRTGVPFRYWDVPLGIAPDARAATRRRWLGDNPAGLLIFHLVPNWAAAHARRLGLGFYDFLPELFEEWFAPLADRIQIVALNDGGLLRSRFIHMQNLATLSPPEFESLLFSADLVLTENGLSISVGKAVCGRQIAAVLRNTSRLSELMAQAEPVVRGVLVELEKRQLGAVYPYEAFPTVTPADLEEIGLYRDNSLLEGFARLEVFGGGATAESLARLLTDAETRHALQERQHRYLDGLARLKDPAEVIEDVIDRG